MSGFRDILKAAHFTVSGNVGYLHREFTLRFFSCGVAIDKRGEDAARDAFVHFVRPQPVKIAVSVVQSKGVRGFARGTNSRTTVIPQYERQRG